MMKEDGVSKLCILLSKPRSDNTELHDRNRKRLEADCNFACDKPVIPLTSDF